MAIRNIVVFFYLVNFQTPILKLPPVICTKCCNFCKCTGALCAEFAPLPLTVQGTNHRASVAQVGGKKVHKCVHICFDFEGKISNFCAF